MCGCRKDQLIATSRTTEKRINQRKAQSTTEKRINQRKANQPQKSESTTEKRINHRKANQPQKSESTTEHTESTEFFLFFTRSEPPGLCVLCVLCVLCGYKALWL